MKLGLGLGHLGSTEIAIPWERIREAERLGFDMVWCAEIWGHDAVVPLTWIAAGTERIGLGTNILQLHGRSPALTANTMTTLDMLSGGRVRAVGIGLSGPQVIEGWHGAPFGRPAKRVAEYMQIMRKVWDRAEPLAFDGEEYRLPYDGPGATGLGKPLRSVLHPRPLPIYVGAIGPLNVRNAAEFGDGWVSTRCPPQRMGVYEPYIDEGLRRAGKRPDEFGIAASVQVIVTADVEEYRGRGKVPEDYWLEDRDGMSPVSRRRSERLGYPTQKPVALLERIIRASSNEGELVLDPFCGCGTAVVAAHNLDRRWIGIDISATAIDIIRERRLEPAGVEAPAFGMPQALADARKLAAEKPFAFERWAIQRIPGLAPNERQRGDGGIDGQGTLTARPDNHDSRRVLAQVKGGRFSLSQFRDFLHVVERGQAACGVYITLDPVTSRQARALAAEQGEIGVVDSPGRYPRVQLWSIAAYFENGSLPALPQLADPYTGKSLAIERRLLR